MKKKIFLILAIMSVLACIFAISISAATIYKTADGTTLFSYVDEDKNHNFESYEGSFPKADNEGNELTWYITSTSNENGDTVHTVSSLKTLGEAGNISDSGAYSFISPVTNKNTVSVNFPDNAGIKTIPAFGAYNTFSQNNILFAYCPNTVIEFNEGAFQETPVIVAELDDETPITFIPHKMFHDARNVEIINIPASVEVIKSIDQRMGAPFCYTYSLKTVTFAENSRLTRIHQFAFYESNIEEIQFPDSLVSINQNLFRGCRNLKVIRFGASFKYFENIGTDDKITANHHSLTHTATGIQAVYLPASFYLSKPDVNYRVSYAFDGCTNAKFFFTGTKEQLDISIANFTNSEWTTGATDHNYIVDAYKANKIVTWAEYSQSPDSYQGRYIIVNYNKCDAFYKGEHLNDTNPCVINCDRCEAYGLAKEKPVHNIGTTVTYVSFDKVGKKTVGCTNKGCTYGTSEDAPAMFSSLGYSASQYGTGGIVMGYTVNQIAIAEYETIMGKKVEYGVFVGLKSTVGSNEIFAEDGTALAGVVCAQITNYEFTVFELKVSGLADEKMNVKLAMGAYVKETHGDEVKYSYMQNDAPNENEKYSFVSYNDIVNSASREN